jgi:hypothetical protein
MESSEQIADQTANGTNEVITQNGVEETKKTQAKVESEQIDTTKK